MIIEGENTMSFEMLKVNYSTPADYVSAINSAVKVACAYGKGQCFVSFVDGGIIISADA